MAVSHFFTYFAAEIPLNVTFRSCYRWKSSLLVARHIRKRVRLFPSGESGQFAILGKWMHEWLVRTEKDDTRSTSIVWCTTVSYCNAILRRCELLFNPFFPHRSVQNLPLEKKAKAHTFLLCLILKLIHPLWNDFFWAWRTYDSWLVYIITINLNNNL